ncbi:hypothetical protein BGZ97_003132 [Linnemannia gamsii]|uniref:Uncharacterized protein n=1 Tax=Linnemannia gamsii TaxID=64522 RepID=A0A9P6UGS4_9FUNG|nr:hypothetical protein BGZ97_003132 [Linnemannia gamsii]
MRQYHDPEPFVLHSRGNPTRPPVELRRDPKQGMYFACSHPACDHTTITSRNACRHFRTCRFLHAGQQSATNLTTTTTAVTRGRSVQRIQGERRSQRYSPRLTRRRYIERNTSSPLLSPSEESEADLDGPSREQITSPVTTTKISSVTTPTLIATTTTLDQVLEAMGQLTNAVAGFTRQFDEQTERFDEIGERMDWLVAQIDEIRSHGASLEVHTESLRINVGLAEDHLSDLLRDNWKVKEEFQAVMEEIGKMGEDVRYLGW